MAEKIERITRTRARLTVLYEGGDKTEWAVVGKATVRGIAMSPEDYAKVYKADRTECFVLMFVYGQPDGSHLWRLMEQGTHFVCEEYLDRHFQRLQGQRERQEAMVASANG